MHFIPQQLHQYRLHNINQLHLTVNFQSQAQRIINKWKDGKWLRPEQKAKIGEVIWFYEKRLMPFIDVQAANTLMQRRQLVQALSLYFQAAQKYFMSFVSLPI